MQICTNCQAKQFDGTIFCSECGASLLPTRHNETTMSLEQRSPIGDLKPPAQQFVPVPANKPTGDNARKTTVRKRSQLRAKVMGRTT